MDAPVADRLAAPSSRLARRTLHQETDSGRFCRGLRPGSSCRPHSVLHRRQMAVSRSTACRRCAPGDRVRTPVRVRALGQLARSRRRVKRVSNNARLASHPTDGVGHNATGCDISNDRSPPTVSTRMLPPSGSCPSSIRAASGSSTSRCSARLSGRAPYAGSNPLSASSRRGTSSGAVVPARLRRPGPPRVHACVTLTLRAVQRGERLVVPSL